MNDTKWDELRRAMCGLGGASPRWRTKDVSGNVSPWDGDWYYHFREGGYDTIHWVEIRTTAPAQQEAVKAALHRVHVPGHRIDEGFRVYGYVEEEAAVGYL
jgi:hypothetical protein